MRPFSASNLACFKNWRAEKKLNFLRIIYRPHSLAIEALSFSVSSINDPMMAREKKVEKQCVNSEEKSVRV